MESRRKQRRDRRRGLGLWLAVTIALGASSAAPAKKEKKEKEGGEMPSVAERTRDLEKRDGVLPAWLDRQGGKLYLELEPPGAGGAVRELLYVEGLARGLGSNPVGLDRGQLGDARRIVIRRFGPKVLFEERNVRFRAESDEAAESRAAAESFATSVLWGGEVAALDPDGRSLVDVTTFVVRDAHGTARRLQETGQGSYSLDLQRSALDPASLLVFPRNLEVEAVLTFAGPSAPSDGPGSEVRSVAPDPFSVTLVQHHSLIALPEPGYRPRAFDPRMGMFAVEAADYGAPLTEPLVRRRIVRHRLEKTDPAAERSPAREPLVYYVDRGAPEPIRSALVEGASWWARAFEAAGFEDAFRVELLPEDAHPLDVRYNVIQWVHRATRGWSYGGGIVDPLTGEMLKGHVSLGSLRIRQDILLFGGLLGTEQTGTGSELDPIELSLARIRQLSAHEVGHTLGITHNFAASTYGGRASVMDYPAPWIRPTADGGLDVGEAYGVGVGSWDVLTVRFGYSDPPPGTAEEEWLEAIVREGVANGQVFVADADARPPGAADPRGNLWDNGDDPVVALEQSLEVRRIALDRFGAGNVAAGRPLAALEEVLVPVYFHHRYQLEAAAKVLAGVEVDTTVRGDGRTALRIVDPDRQRRALDAILGILDPARLDLPESVLEVLAPRPFGWSRTREQAASATQPLFDAIGVAETAASQVAEVLLEPTRLSRLIDQSRRLPAPTVEEVLESLSRQAFRGDPVRGRSAEVARAIERAVVARWIATAADPATPRRLAHRLDDGLRGLASRLEAPVESAAWSAHRAGLRSEIRRWLERRGPSEVMPQPPADLPPGSPIGAGGCDFAGPADGSP